VEVRRRARAFVLGLLADLPRTNCWTIAEHAGDASPDGMQHLLGRAIWVRRQCVTMCAPMWSSTPAMPRRSWWWMRPEIPRRAPAPATTDGKPPKTHDDHDLWLED
jgi:hypothetical protein